MKFEYLYENLIQIDENVKLKFESFSDIGELLEENSFIKATNKLVNNNSLLKRMGDYGKALAAVGLVNVRGVDLAKFSPKTRNVILKTQQMLTKNKLRFPSKRSDLSKPEYRQLMDDWNKLMHPNDTETDGKIEPYVDKSIQDLPSDRKIIPMKGTAGGKEKTMGFYIKKVIDKGQNKFALEISYTKNQDLKSKESQEFTGYVDTYENEDQVHAKYNELGTPGEVLNYMYDHTRITVNVDALPWNSILKKAKHIVSRMTTKEYEELDLDEDFLGKPQPEMETEPGGEQSNQDVPEADTIGNNVQQEPQPQDTEEENEDQPPV